MGARRSDRRPRAARRLLVGRGRLRVPQHRASAARSRATAESSSSRSSRSRSTRFLADAVVRRVGTGRTVLARVRGSGSRAGLAVVIVVPVAADRRAQRTAPRRLAAGRDPPGQRQGPRPHPGRDRRAVPPEQPLPARRPRARSRRPRVFPESSMDADPRTDPYLRSHLVAVARRNHAWVLANAVADAPAHGNQPAGAKALNLNVLFAARRLGRGHVREAPPRAVRRVRPVPRRARRPRIGELEPDPARLRARPHAGPVRDRGPQGRDRSSASSRRSATRCGRSCTPARR